MDKLACVCLGSALGGGARYLLGQGALALLGPAFPWGTLAVNLLGSFLMGLLGQLVAHGAPLPANAQLFLATGILGGFTTYSSFNQETLQLAARGCGWLAALNGGATLVGCLLAGLAGAATARALLGGSGSAT
jgi:fluoride exporter